MKIFAPIIMMVALGLLVIVMPSYLEDYWFIVIILGAIIISINIALTAFDDN